MSAPQNNNQNNSNKRLRLESAGRSEGDGDDEAQNTSGNLMNNFDHEALIEIEDMISSGEKLMSDATEGLRPRRSLVAFSSSSAQQRYVDSGAFEGWNKLFCRLQQRLALNYRHWFMQIQFDICAVYTSFYRVNCAEVLKRLIWLKKLKNDVENQTLLSIVRREIEQDVLNEILSQADRCLARNEFHAVMLLSRASLELVMKHLCTARNIDVKQTNPTAGIYLEALKKNGLTGAYFHPWKTVIEWGNGVAHSKPNRNPVEQNAKEILNTVKIAVENGLSLESSELFQKPNSTKL